MNKLMKINKLNQNMLRFKKKTVSKKKKKSKTGTDAYLKISSP